ncbi:heme-degrading domain-containing protein [Pararhizobium haloflavum]|uniref:heme-degrading domain-containing protein n=1 Tax=Pararhizobium haloflavum TaxID=2037914 RepID=UPI000C1959F8|nr:heme-degrading domain-containing protein [Pararhizobium haloflavum]
MEIDSDLDHIARQETLLKFQRFDADLAWKIGRTLHDRASARSVPVTIDVSLFSMQMFFAAMHGATPDNIGWVRRKKNTVFRFLRSSYATGLMLKRDKTTLAAKFALPDADYAAHGGSFPLTVEGAGVIGAVTVSGLPQRDDHSMVVEALASVLGKDPAKLRLP